MFASFQTPPYPTSKEGSLDGEMDVGDGPFDVGDGVLD
jgi:hypothetical protein